MSRGYVFTRPAQIDAVGGDPNTGTAWNVAFETARLALLNQIANLMDIDVSFLFEQIGAAGVDNLTYQYKSATAITVAAGTAASDDGLVSYSIATPTDVSLDSDMDTGSKAASKTYYVWIGQDTVTEDTKLKFSLSATAPTNLNHPHKLKWYVTTDGSSNLVAFWHPFGDDVNDVIYAYTDADTITLAAGSKFTVSDGTLCRLEAPTALKISTGRTADIGAEAANTLYYIWGGLKVSDGSLGFYVHTSAALKPSELAQARLLPGAVRNDNSSDLISFLMTARAYEYDAAIAVAGSDVTEVFDATLTTSWQDCTCTAFVPAGSRTVSVVATTATTTFHSIRQKGSALAGYPFSFANSEIKSYQAMVNSVGVYQVYNSSSEVTRISVRGYTL
jgi:hypothetical protein